MQAVLPTLDTVTMMMAHMSRALCTGPVLRGTFAAAAPLTGSAAGTLKPPLPSPTMSLLSKALYLGMEAMVGTGLFPLFILLGLTPAVG